MSPSHAVFARLANFRPDRCSCSGLASVSVEAAIPGQAPHTPLRHLDSRMGLSAQENHLALQAALEAASKDRLVVTAAAAAHAKQDRTPAAAALSLGSTEAHGQDGVPPSAAAEPKQPKPAAAGAQAAASKPATATVSMQSLTTDLARQVSEEEGHVDASLTRGPNSPTAKSPSAAASLVPTSPTAPSALPAPKGPTAPEGPTAPAPAGPTAPAPPTALCNPPAHTTKQSSKKRKQAKQPSKGAAGTTVGQRKRKKPSGSEVTAAGAGSGLAHQGEAKTSVSTLDYTVDDPSGTTLGDAGHGGEVASPNKEEAEQREDADPNPVRAQLALVACKPKWLPLSPTSSSLAARESRAAQHVGSPPVQEPPTAAEDTHMQAAGPTYGAHPPQQHVGSPSAQEAPSAADDTHMQVAGPTHGGDASQQHVGSTPIQEPPATADDTHMQAADPTPGAHPSHQQSSLQADDRSRQNEPVTTVERHGSQQRQDTAKEQQQQQQETPHQQQQQLELPQLQQDQQELHQQQLKQQQKELPHQQQQQQQEHFPGPLSQPAQSKGSDHSQEQLSAGEAEGQHQRDAEVIRPQSA